jgi:hypothetical protein
MTDEDISVIPVVAAAVQVSEAQETRDAANEATEAATTAQAEAEVAGNTALAAEADAQTASEVAVASAGIGIEAAVSAEEAKQEAGQALSEVGQLRADLFDRLDQIQNLVKPPEPEPEPDNGVTEVTLDGTDIGESGIERGSSKETPVSGDNAGSTSSSNTRTRGLRRGKR